MQLFTHVAFLIVLTLIELLLVPLPFAFIALFLMRLRSAEGEAMLLAFLLGFLFDVLLLRTLGTTSIVFISLLFATTVYERKYAAHNLFFLASAMFISTLVLEFSYGKTLAVAAAMVSMLITLLLARWYVPFEHKYESWYRFS